MHASHILTTLQEDAAARDLRSALLLSEAHVAPHLPQEQRRWSERFCDSRVCHGFFCRALSLGLSWDIWDAPKMAARINGKIWKDESWWSTMRFCTRTLISDTLRWLGRLRVSDEKGISFASAMPSTFKSTVNAGSDEDTSVDKPGNTKRNDAFCWEYSNWLFRFCVNVLHRSPSAFGLYTLTPAQPTTNIDQYHCWESDLIPGKHSKCSGGFMHCAFTTIILKPLKPCRTEATSPRIPCRAWGSPSAQTSEALRRP